MEKLNKVNDTKVVSKASQRLAAKGVIKRPVAKQVDQLNFPQRRKCQLDSDLDKDAQQPLPKQTKENKSGKAKTGKAANRIANNFSQDENNNATKSTLGSIERPVVGNAKSLIMSIKSKNSQVDSTSKCIDPCFKNVLCKELREEAVQQQQQRRQKIASNEPIPQKHKVVTWLFSQGQEADIHQPSGSMQSATATTIYGADGINLTVHAAEVGDTEDEFVSAQDNQGLDEILELEPKDPTGQFEATDKESDVESEGNEVLAVPIDQSANTANNIGLPVNGCQDRPLQEQLKEDDIESLKQDPKIKLLFKMLSELGRSPPNNRHKTTGNGNNTTDRIKSPSDTMIYVPALKKVTTPLNTVEKLQIQSNLGIPIVQGQMVESTNLGVLPHNSDDQIQNDKLQVDQTENFLNQMHLISGNGRQGAGAVAVTNDEPSELLPSEPSPPRPGTSGEPQTTREQRIKAVRMLTKCCSVLNSSRHHW